MMELRLAETLAEAKRHYESYMDIRDQYNAFLEGRINQLSDIMLCKQNNPKLSPIKQQKTYQDAIQTLKVNL